MKKNNLIYWFSTSFIFLFEGVLTALTSQSEMAKEGIRHLGYPAYFGVTLAVFHVAGAVILMIPKIPARVKEWAYAGFAFDFIFAFISNWAVAGFNATLLFPVVVMAILLVSYISYHKKIVLGTGTGRREIVV
jgi:DoxX-like family